MGVREHVAAADSAILKGEYPRWDERIREVVVGSVILLVTLELAYNELEVPWLMVEEEALPTVRNGNRKMR